MNYSELTDALAQAEANGKLRPYSPDTPSPDRNMVIVVLKEIQALLFPGYYYTCREMDVPVRLARIHDLLLEQVTAAYHYCDTCTDSAEDVCNTFLSALPRIKALLLTDIEALYEGDPAARCREEVLICYPGFRAISIYRIAHELHVLGVPFLPRIMTEYAHEKTGVDIHAGATVGEYFFIDHGTGIVIGETTVIGNHVKLYQGVTLGAKSFELDENGNPVKNIKRHPNIGNHVVIYANATILGGKTTVGDGCTIGGNVWLTHSVEPGKTVYYKDK